MAKKNGETTEGEAPVKKAPAKSEDKYASLQSKRRELEAELSSIDGQIRDAINAGDVDHLAKLTARKGDLPGLFIAASMAEKAARNDIQNAEDAAHLASLKVAEADRDKKREALAKYKAEAEANIAVLSEDLQHADNLVGEVYASINASRALGAAGDAGFRKSLAALAGV